jgi:eukaryotic-like serine/threonine-protein kinase
MAYPPLTGLFAERYLIERELGHGATAVVYLAHDNKHDREIALKVLSKDLAHALGPQRFLQEIHLTARLHHPHILPIFDSGEWNGLLYYVLPFVRGESLRQKLDRENQLPIEECVRITCEVADALAHAHAAGVVHRDVKPENILLSDGHALLADFGIARALDVHTGERLTSSGLIVGTSAYMSPEQAAGEEKIDARSDIYSLACVLYEMLAGVQAFTGPTTQSVIAQRFKHKPRPVSTYRPQVPEYLEHALEKALAISPADRYRKIKEFSADLPDVPSASRDRRQSPIRRTIHEKQKAFGFAAAALVIAMAAFVAVNPPGSWSSPFARSATLDSMTYIVLPSASSDRDEVGKPDIDAALHLDRALQRWNGITVVPPEVMKSAIAEGRRMQNDEAFDLARKYKAGRLVLINAAGDASLYSVATRKALAEVSRNDVKGSGDEDSAAVLRLLRAPDRPNAADGGDGLTRSFPAWNAYGSGHALLAAGRVADARKEFALALTHDPEFIPALLWNAQLTAWISPDSVQSWNEAATKAGFQSARLAPRDSILAAALAAMAAARFPDACRLYGGLTQSDPMDFAGWIGLAQCNEQDSLIVRNGSSPSGWSFRGSFGAAANAYVQALKILPAAYDFAFARIEKLLPSASIRIRGGRTAAPGSQVLGAYPSLDHDTVAFVPYPIAQFVALPPGATRTHAEALKHDRDVLLALATEWSRKAPQNPAALEAFASALETSGNISDPGNGAPSAVDAVRKARALTSDSRERLELIATEARLKFKLGDFSAAETLADSALKNDTGGDPLSLAILAALTGRVAAMARWSDRAHVPNLVGFSSVPPQLSQPAAEFFSRAALGLCGEATDKLESKIEQQLQSYVRENERPAMRFAIESRSLGMLGPCTNGKSALRVASSRDRLNRMQQEYAKGNYQRVRALLDSVRKSRSDRLPGDISFDYTYQESWLRAAIGDSSGAAAGLDLALNALPSLSIPAINDPAAAAAVGRALIFRADLAVKMNDFATARKSAAAVAALWAHTDAELQPEVRRMRALAGSH